MLAKIRYQLSVKDGDISQAMASLFHGALIELLPLEYASYLHLSQLNPFSQHLEQREGNWYWEISTFTQEAYRIIIQESLTGIHEIYLKHKDMTVQLEEVSRIVVPKRQLLDIFHGGNKSRTVELEFLTPTAFKQRGEYLFFPDIFCIYQSLLNKYSAASDNVEVMDEETLEQLCRDTKIIGYRLRSAPFYLEGVRVPGFLGRVTLKIKGAQTMVNFAHALFEFGRYSGIGIKCSLGMGAITVDRRE